MTDVISKTMWRGGGAINLGCHGFQHLRMFRRGRTRHEGFDVHGAMTERTDSRQRGIDHAHGQGAVGTMRTLAVFHCLGTHFSESTFFHSNSPIFENSTTNCRTIHWYTDMNQFLFSRHGTPGRMALYVAYNIK